VKIGSSPAVGHSVRVRAHIYNEEEAMDKSQPELFFLGAFLVIVIALFIGFIG
jgi:hypothetical protein